MGQAIIGHSIRHEIRFGLDFLATIAHGYAHSTVFKHRNVYLGITKGNGVLNPATDMLQQFINGMSLGNAPHPQVTKQGRFPDTTPGSRLEVREGFLGCQEVIVAFQDEAVRK